ncbi:CHAT domain-containing protein [bacterium]|nr:CHAT domain-containing protein [bacterium]
MLTNSQISSDSNDVPLKETLMDLALLISVLTLQENHMKLPNLCFCKTLKIFINKLPGGFLLLIFLFINSCSTTSTPNVGVLSDSTSLLKAEIEKWILSPPASAGKTHMKSPLLESKISMPKAGDKSVFGFTITKELELAFSTYLGGDGEAALKALHHAETTSLNPGFLWQVSFLRAQVLVMMGQAANAEAELKKTSKLEAAFVGHNLNTMALRGEVKIWLEDYDGAFHDFAQVVKAIGTWELPTSYSSFPTNRIDLYSLTTAKLRSYTGIAGIHVMRKNFQQALDWASESERLYSNAHFVVSHPLFGMGDTLYADNYYGRAMNLSFLAAANLAVTKDVEASNVLFDKADRFYQAIGYSTGQVTNMAIKAMTYNILKMHDLCYKTGQKALSLAIEKGLPDFIWRIGVLTGKTQLSHGDKTGAETSFRQAQAAVNQISGSLTTDRAKIRFGVGKEDITYHLAQLDLEKKDWNTLFEDLEQGRARAFVDMLSDVPQVANRETVLMDQIRQLDRQITTQRLKNMAPGADSQQNSEKENVLVQQRQKLIIVLKSNDSELADLVSISVLKLEDIQSKLKKGDTIAYAIPTRNDDPIKFLLIKKNRVDIKTLAFTDSELKKCIHDFSASFLDVEKEKDERGVVLKSTAGLKNGAEKSSEEKTVALLKNTLAGIQLWDLKQTLFIVPTGSLYFVPWGVLDLNIPITVLPTGGWLNRTVKRLTTEKQITIVGDPEFGGKMPPLPGANSEARLLGKLYNTDPLLGTQASEKNLRLNMGKGVSILHLATHGTYDPSDPLESAIYLTENQSAFALTARKLFQNPLPAKLVILSACETGLGETVAGDDLLGLTRSFYLGGTITTLSSLWSIEDEGTKLFMEHFHQQATSGNYGEAWLKARNHVKEKGYPPSVYGAFILGGIPMSDPVLAK